VTVHTHTGRVIVADSVVLVTGASSGIGRATAQALARRGARLLLHGRDERALAELAALTGGTPLAADLADPTQVVRLAQRALSATGRVDALVANAGAGWAGPFVAQPESDLDRLLAVNLAAAIRLTRALLPAMLERRSGYLAYVSSIAGRTGGAGEAVYAASKAGLDAFAESLRLELAGTGVDVGVLVPGVVDTAFFARRGQPYRRSRPRPLPAAQVGERLARMVERGDAEVYRPAWLRLPVAVRAVAPAAYRALAARFGGS
jgi:short-subunit dehydrogenase